MRQLLKLRVKVYDQNMIVCIAQIEHSQCSIATLSVKQYYNTVAALTNQSYYLTTLSLLNYTQILSQLLSRQLKILIYIAYQLFTGMDEL